MSNAQLPLVTGQKQDTPNQNPDQQGQQQQGQQPMSNDPVTGESKAKKKKKKKKKKKNAANANASTEDQGQSISPDVEVEEVGEVDSPIDSTTDSPIVSTPIDPVPSVQPTSTESTATTAASTQDIPESKVVDSNVIRDVSQQTNAEIVEPKIDLEESSTSKPQQQEQPESTQDDITKPTEIPVETALSEAVPETQNTVDQHEPVVESHDEVQNANPQDQAPVQTALSETVEEIKDTAPVETIDVAQPAPVQETSVITEESKEINEAKPEDQIPVQTALSESVEGIKESAPETIANEEPSDLFGGQESSSLPWESKDEKSMETSNDDPFATSNTDFSAVIGQTQEISQESAPAVEDKPVEQPTTEDSNDLFGGSSHDDDFSKAINAQAPQQTSEPESVQSIPATAETKQDTTSDDLFGSSDVNDFTAVINQSQNQTPQPVEPEPQHQQEVQSHKPVETAKGTDELFGSSQNDDFSAVISQNKPVEQVEPVKAPITQQDNLFGSDSKADDFSSIINNDNVEKKLLIETPAPVDNKVEEAVGGHDETSDVFGGESKADEFAAIINSNNDQPQQPSETAQIQASNTTSTPVEPEVKTEEPAAAELFGGDSKADEFSSILGNNKQQESQTTQPNEEPASELFGGDFKGEDFSALISGSTSPAKPAQPTEVRKGEKKFSFLELDMDDDLLDDDDDLLDDEPTQPQPQQPTQSQVHVPKTRANYQPTQPAQPVQPQLHQQQQQQHHSFNPYTPQANQYQQFQPSQPQTQSHLDIRKLNANKQKSDAYDFPIDLVAQKAAIQKPARSVSSTPYAKPFGQASPSPSLAAATPQANPYAARAPSQATPPVGPPRSTTPAGISPAVNANKPPSVKKKQSSFFEELPILPPVAPAKPVRRASNLSATGSIDSTLSGAARPPPVGMGLHQQNRQVPPPNPYAAPPQNRGPSKLSAAASPLITPNVPSIPQNSYAFPPAGQQQPPSQPQPQAQAHQSPYAPQAAGLAPPVVPGPPSAPPKPNRYAPPPSSQPPQPNLSNFTPALSPAHQRRTSSFGQQQGIVPGPAPPQSPPQVQPAAAAQPPTGQASKYAPGNQYAPPSAPAAASSLAPPNGGFQNQGQPPALNTNNLSAALSPSQSYLSPNTPSSTRYAPINHRRQTSSTANQYDPYSAAQFQKQQATQQLPTIAQASGAPPHSQYQPPQAQQQQQQLQPPQQFAQQHTSPYAPGQGLPLPSNQFNQRPASQFSSQPAVEKVANPEQLLSRQFPVFSWGSGQKLSYYIKSNNYMTDNIKIVETERLLNDVSLKEFPTISKKNISGILTYLDKQIQHLSATLSSSSEEHELILAQVLKFKLSKTEGVFNLGGAINYVEPVQAFNEKRLGADAKKNLSKRQLVALISAGEKEQALNLALGHQDYSLALLISSVMGKDAWLNMVKNYLAVEFSGDHDNFLSTLFQILSGDVATVIKEFNTIPQKKIWALNNWKELTNAVLANNSLASAPFINEFGKFLIDNEFIIPAYILLILGDAPLTALQSVKSLRLTLYLEIYGLVLHEKGIVSDLSAIYLQHASYLADYNSLIEAQKYLDAATTAFKASKGSVNPRTLYYAKVLSERLASTGSGDGSWFGRPKLDKVWGTLDKSLNKFISGGEEGGEGKSKESGVFSQFTPTVSRTSSYLSLQNTAQVQTQQAYPAASRQQSQPPPSSSRPNMYAPAGVSADQDTFPTSRLAHGQAPNAYTPPALKRPESNIELRPKVGKPPLPSNPYAANAAAVPPFGQPPKIGAHTPLSSRGSSPRASLAELYGGSPNSKPSRYTPVVNNDAASRRSSVQSNTGSVVYEPTADPTTPGNPALQPKTSKSYLPPKAAPAPVSSHTSLDQLIPPPTVSQIPSRSTSQAQLARSPNIAHALPPKSHLANSYRPPLSRTSSDFSQAETSAQPPVEAPSTIPPPPVKRSVPPPPPSVKKPEVLPEFVAQTAIPPPPITAPAVLKESSIPPAIPTQEPVQIRPDVDESVQTAEEEPSSEQFDNTQKDEVEQQQDEPGISHDPEVNLGVSRIQSEEFDVGPSPVTEFKSNYQPPTDIEEPVENVGDDSQAGDDTIDGLSFDAPHKASTSHKPYAPTPPPVSDEQAQSFIPEAEPEAKQEEAVVPEVTKDEVASAPVQGQYQPQPQQPASIPAPAPVPAPQPQTLPQPQISTPTEPKAEPVAQNKPAPKKGVVGPPPVLPPINHVSPYAPKANGSPSSAQKRSSTASRFTPRSYTPTNPSREPEDLSGDVDFGAINHYQPSQPIPEPPKPVVQQPQPEPVQAQEVSKPEPAIEAQSPMPAPAPVPAPPKASQIPSQGPSPLSSRRVSSVSNPYAPPPPPASNPYSPNLTSVNPSESKFSPYQPNVPESTGQSFDGSSGVPTFGTSKTSQFAPYQPGTAASEASSINVKYEEPTPKFTEYELPKTNNISDIPEDDEFYDDVVDDEDDDDDDDEDDNTNGNKAAKVERKRSVKRNKDQANKNNGWFGWLRKNDNGPKVYRAKLGEENRLIYDENLKRWIDKDAKPEDIKAAAAPPPPPVIKKKPSSLSKPRSDSVSEGSIKSPLGNAPPSLSSGGPPSSSVPPGPPGASPGLSGSATLPPKKPASAASDLDSLIGLAGGPSSATTRRKKRGGRGYVDVMGSMQQKK